MPRPAPNRPYTTHDLPPAAWAIDLCHQRPAAATYTVADAACAKAPTPAYAELARRAQRALCWMTVLQGATALLLATAMTVTLVLTLKMDGQLDAAYEAARPYIDEATTHGLATLANADAASASAALILGASETLASPEMVASAQSAAEAMLAGALNSTQSIAGALSAVEHLAAVGAPQMLASLESTSAMVERAQGLLANPTVKLSLV